MDSVKNARYEAGALSQAEVGRKGGEFDLEVMLARENLASVVVESR